MYTPWHKHWPIPNAPKNGRNSLPNARSPTVLYVGREQASGHLTTSRRSPMSRAVHVAAALAATPSRVADHPAATKPNGVVKIPLPTIRFATRKPAFAHEALVFAVVWPTNESPAELACALAC
jgi:hypothetical protein